MRFEIKIVHSPYNIYPLLDIFLFTKDSHEDGVYGSSCELDNEMKTLLEKINIGVNACLSNYEKDMEETIKNIIKKYQPALSDFYKMHYQDQLVHG